MQGIVFMIDEFVLFRFFNGYIPVRTGYGNVCIKSMNRRRNYRSFNFKFKISDQIKKYCTQYCRVSQRGFMNFLNCNH